MSKIRFKKTISFIYYVFHNKSSHMYVIVSLKTAFISSEDKI